MFIDSLNDFHYLFRRRVTTCQRPKAILS
jgi:hypothetical protein